MGDERIHDLEEVRGADWSRTTWSVPADDRSFVLVRQTLTSRGDQEVVWRVPTERIGELAALLGCLARDTESLLAWTEEEPDRLDVLVETLGRMDPSVVDAIELG